MKVRYFAGLCLLTALAGCARSPSGSRIVYDPPPAPNVFSLHMSPGPDHGYVISGKDYSFTQAEAYLKQQVSMGTHPYTVLLENSANQKLPAYFCYVVLMHQSGAVGYFTDGGHARAIKITFANTARYDDVKENCESQ